MQSLAAVGLDALDDLDELGVNLFRRLHAADLGDDILGSVVRHDGGKLLGLLVILDILETKGHLDGVEEVLDLAAILGNLGGGADEALLARELAERGATDALDGILEMRVADALDNLVDVGSLRIVVDAVLADNQALGLVEGAANLGHDGLVLQRIVDGALSAVVAVVGGGGVAGVDGEELALDKGGEVVDPVDALNVGDADVLKRRLLDDPLEELFERHVEAGVGVLGGDDAVNGRIGVAGAGVVVVDAVLGGVVGTLDELGERVGGANGVFAGNDGKGLEVRRAAVDALGDDGGDELEDAGPDGAGDDVGGADLVDELGLVRLGVDGAVVCNLGLGGALDADLDDAVRGGGVDGVNQGVGNVGKDDLIARVVEKAGDEATALSKLLANRDSLRDLKCGGRVRVAMTCSGAALVVGGSRSGVTVWSDTVRCKKNVPMLPAPK